MKHQAGAEPPEGRADTKGSDAGGADHQRVVASARKNCGLGSAVVRLCLQSLADAGGSEVGATITDGNIASERLFIGLGFSRYGSY